MIRESEQKNTIIGKVVEIKEREGTLPSGVPYIAGTVSVETGKDNVIPVSFFAGKTTKSGGVNSIYGSLKTVVQDYKSIAKYGRDEADTIKVDASTIKENIYFPTPERKIRGWQISAPFFNRKAGAEPEGIFTVTGEIFKVDDEIVNDVPTGNLIVRLIVITYGDEAHILDFHVEGEKAVKYVNTNFVEKMEVKLSGEIKVVEKIKENTTESAFGDPIVESTRVVERKLLVKSATPPIDSSMTDQERERILAERESKIAEAREKAKVKTNNTSKSTENFTL